MGCVSGKYLTIELQIFMNQVRAFAREGCFCLKECIFLRQTVYERAGQAGEILLLIREGTVSEMHWHEYEFRKM